MLQCINNEVDNSNINALLTYQPRYCPVVFVGPPPNDDVSIYLLDRLALGVCAEGAQICADSLFHFSSARAVLHHSISSPRRRVSRPVQRPAVRLRLLLFSGRVRALRP